MISITQLVEVLGLSLFAYFVFLFKQALELYKEQNYTNYKAYKKSVSQTASSIFKPKREQDDISIHEVRGDRQKITTKKPTGISKTDDANIDLDQADPEAVMAFIDEQGNGR